MLLVGSGRDRQSKKMAKNRLTVAVFADFDRFWPPSVQKMPDLWTDAPAGLLFTSHLAILRKYLAILRSHLSVLRKRKTSLPAVEVPEMPILGTSAITFGSFCRKNCSGGPSIGQSRDLRFVTSVSSLHFFFPVSSLRYPLSSIFSSVSSFRYPLFSIFFPVSSFQFLLSSILFHFFSPVPVVLFFL